MAKINVDKNDFYKRAMELIADATKSVHFYSVSCCWGFYSFGVKNFEQMLLAILERSKFRIGGKYLDVRVLVKVDADNPMDVFAVERLAAVQGKLGKLTGEGGATRNIFRELTESAAVQFLIVDGERILSSESQQEWFNENLSLVLNVSQPGKLFEQEDDEKEFHRLEKLFEAGWNSGFALVEKAPRFSRRQLRYILESYSGVQPAKTERELQLLITGYLKREIDHSIIDFEAMVVETRIDLLIGPKPNAQRSGVEIKLKPEDKDIDGIVGKLRNYRTNYSDLVLLVGLAEFTPRGRQRLLTELRSIDVPLIEIR
jgi:hypothetical protein